MKFSELNVKPCALASMTPPGCATGDTTPTTGNPTVGCEDADYRVAHPGECDDEADCADPAFAEAHPELCLGTTRLILKPAVAVIEARQSIQFRAYLWKDGVEQEVTGARFAVMGTGVAVIGLTSGNATGVAAGITTVSAAYAGMTAHAQIEVVSSCLTRANYFALIFDVSKSMTAPMGGSYATRLSAAKSLGQGFVQCLRDKDWMGVWKFDTGASELVGFNFTKATTKAVIGSISSSNATQTDVSSGLTAATAAFDAAGVGAANRIYVLFTDGENKQGANPVALARGIRESGAVVMIVGLRAYGTWFQQLELMASGGMFLNATPTNIATIGDMLNGLKAYFCSGKCEDAGGYNGAVPALDYTGFEKWTVTGGTVDLIGRGAFAMFDIHPGHGLYPDMCGSMAGTSALGTIQTTNAIAFTAGHTMTLRFKLAGNGREERAADVVRVSVRRTSDDLEVAWRDYSLAATDEFAEHSYTWTALAGDHVIIISQRSIGGGTDVFGCSVDDIVLTDDTDDEVLFEDNFDQENITRIPLACGADTMSDASVNVDCTAFAGTCEQISGTWYFTGYDCDTGCGCAVDTTGAQVPDSQPVADLEGNPVIDPVIFTASRRYQATCAEGDSGDPVSRSAVATSEISQADADARALAAATAAATAALVCVAPVEVGDIINLRLWPNAPMTGVSAAQIAADRKTGFGAVGLSHEDFWNQPGAALANDTTLSTSHQPIYKHTGELTGVQFFNLPAPGNANTFLRMEHPEPLLRWTAIFPGHANYIYQIKNLPAGTYVVIAFGHSNADDGGGVFGLSNGATDYGDVTLTDSAAWQSATLNNLTHYAKWSPVTVLASGILYISTENNVLAQTLLGAIQIARIT
jgi:hypothetical protein